MQRMPREGSEGDSGSKIQRSLNHANLEVQRKVVNSTPTTRHKVVMLLYYTSNFNVCWIASWFQMKYFWLQSTFYTQFSVKSQNTVILTVKWTRYFWARSYSGWVLSSYFLKQCSIDSNFEYYRFLCNVNPFSATNSFIQSAKNYIIFIIFARRWRSKIAVFLSFFEFLPSIYQPRYLLLFLNPLQHVNMTKNFSQI